MKQNVTRRNFLATAGVAALATGLTRGAEEAPKGNTLKILGVACSMRPGKTTAAGVQAALAGAKGVSPRIETNFVDLGGKDLWSGALGRRSPDGSPLKDDFDEVLAKLKDPNSRGSSSVRRPTTGR